MKRERSPIPELPHITKKAGTCTNLTKRELLYRYMYAHLLLTAWNKIAWNKSEKGKRKERSLEQERERKERGSERGEI